MSAIEELEHEYLAKNGITPAQEPNALPPGFRDALPSLKSDPTARVADIDTRTANVRRLIDQLDSADNNVVKLQKIRVIRAELNALHQLEALDS